MIANLQNEDEYLMAYFIRPLKNKILFMKSAFLFLFVALLTIACSAPRKGLVGEYLFNGNTFDNTSFQNHGQNNGAALCTGHKKKKNSAYNFNGTDQYISIPNSSQNNFTSNDNFTISFWVSVANNQNDRSAAINDILRKWRGDTQGYPFAIVSYNNSAPDSTKNTFSFARYDGSICRHAPAVYSSKYTPERFTHVVCIKEGAVLKIYINNELASQATDTTLPDDACGSHNNADITLGTRGNLVRYFTGAIDDLRFYNRALSKQEISRLFKY